MVSSPKSEVMTSTKNLTRFQKIKKKFWKDRYLYLIFTLPFLYFVIFHYLPIYGIIISFVNYKPLKGVFGSNWVGLQYYIEFFTDPYAYKLMRNTALLSFYSIIFGFPVPIILALSLNELTREWFKRSVQTVSYLPHFISTVVVAGMVISFTNSDGIVSQIIVALGGQIPKPPLIARPDWFREIYVISGVWQHAGWASILYLAALSGIDPQLYEAETIDGAGRFQKMWYVTIPGLVPTIIILLLLDLGRIMVVGWEKILLLYTGNTYETADVLQTYIYRRGIESTDFGYATAVGVVQGLIGLIFVMVANSIAKRTSETSLW